jgi:hypothetical protein
MSLIFNMDTSYGIEVRYSTCYLKSGSVDVWVQMFDRAVSLKQRTTSESARLPFAAEKWPVPQTLGRSSTNLEEVTSTDGFNFFCG